MLILDGTFSIMAPSSESEVKQFFLSLGHIISDIDIFYVPRQDHPGWKGRPRCKYKLIKAGSPKVAEYCGLIHEQALDSPSLGKPSLQSLTPESRIDFFERLCLANNPKLQFVREEPKTGKIYFRYLEGRFAGHEGVKIRAELKKGCTESDIRPLINPLSWVQEALLPGCKIHSLKFPSGAGGRGKLHYSCPNNHECAFPIGYLLGRYGSDLIPCRRCNSKIPLEKRMVENRVFASSRVNLYLCLTRVHGPGDESKCSERPCPLDRALKIGFFERDPMQRSQKYIESLLGEPVVTHRIIAYLVEQMILEEFNDLTVADELISNGHFCDGYTEMIRDEPTIRTALVARIRQLHLEFANMNEAQRLSELSRMRRRNYSRHRRKLAN